MDPERSERFEALFGEYRRYVRGVGKRILGRRDDLVEDLVQDVFLVLYEGFDNLEGLRSTRAWIATVAARIAWRHAGTPKRFSLSLDELEVVDELRAPAASPEVQADLAALLERLRVLPNELREPWLLRFVEGETLPDIAARCDCSQSTVQRRLRDAGAALLPSEPASTRQPLAQRNRKEAALASRTSVPPTPPSVRPRGAW